MMALRGGDAEVAVRGYMSRGGIYCLFFWLLSFLSDTDWSSSLGLGYGDERTGTVHVFLRLLAFSLRFHLQDCGFQGLQGLLFSPHTPIYTLGPWVGDVVARSSWQRGLVNAVVYTVFLYSGSAVVALGVYEQFSVQGGNNTPVFRRLNPYHVNYDAQN